MQSFMRINEFVRIAALLVLGPAFVVGASSAPGFSDALGWRLPVRDEPAPLPEVGGGWVLPVSGTAVPDAMGRRISRPANRPVKRLFDGASAVLTGFSGHSYGRPVLPEDQRAAARLNPDYQVIDLDGAVVDLTEIEGYGHAMNGDEVTRPVYDRLFARQIGQVFGVVIDNDLHPNLYVSATSAFGLQFVGPDTDADTLPDRLTKGDTGARWMAGQWGDDPQAGPGTIWRVDGLTGQIAVFANLTHEGRENPGAALGNLAYDAHHKQLFASDLATGLISRLDARGQVREAFDHGATARPAEGLEAVDFNASGRVEITDTAFDALDPATWGFAPDARRVWGLTVAEGRLFYAVASGVQNRPEVWSVGIDRKTGAFADDPRWELTLADALPGYEVSDIGFAADGAMVLAQRGPRAPKYDFTEMAEVGQAEVVRYVREAPEDDPDTASVWVAVPLTYAVGFADRGANATGGLAFGPAYDAEGFLDYTQCRSTLWTTGENLRHSNLPELARDLMPGGQLRVDGVQAQPIGVWRDLNTPPWVSYAHDRDGTYPEKPQVGFTGDVAVLGCDAAQSLASADGGGGSGAGGGDWLSCALDPKACKPRVKACVKTAVTLRCDGKTGTYVADIGAVPLHKTSLDRVKLTDPSGKITSLPAQSQLPGNLSVPLTGLASSQIGQIALCSYDAKAAATGKPYDCCNSTVEFKLPAKACVKDIQ